MAAKSQLAGAILAAGRSERMGTPKALLALKGETFAARCARILRESGIERIILVTNPDTDESLRNVADTVINPRPEDGMISSILLAAEALGEPEKLVITLVDIPEIKASVVRKLIAAPITNETLIVLPKYDDGQGHPLMLTRGVYPLLSTELPQGLKTLIEQHPSRVLEVDCQGGQPWDFDTPADYERVAR